jgi:hypothetical protein
MRYDNKSTLYYLPLYGISPSETSPSENVKNSMEVVINTSAISRIST